MFEKLTSNTIAFILTVIHYIISKYKTGSKRIDNFYGSIISGQYISSVLLPIIIL